MAKRVVDLRTQGRPLLDVASYGRRGPTHRPALTHAEVAHAIRTVRGVPEVVIKVSGGARTIRGVAAHLEYLETRADLETDDGAVLTEKGLGRDLLKDWDLEVDEIRRHTSRAIAAGRKPPKLVHNLVFSMPKGTPADRLHKAVRKFAVEKFGLQHRYAMALHTDQAHPHVHVVVKAISEQGERINIRNATLREWRRDFAQYLRDHGVEANATDRAVRGSHHQNRGDGIFRAARRGESTFMRERVELVAREVAGGGLRAERVRHNSFRHVGRWSGVARLRRNAAAGWNARSCRGCQAACGADADRTDGPGGNSAQTPFPPTRQSRAHALARVDCHNNLVPASHGQPRATPACTIDLFRKRCRHSLQPINRPLKHVRPLNRRHRAVLHAVLVLYTDHGAGAQQPAGPDRAQVAGHACLCKPLFQKRIKSQKCRG